MKLACIMGHPVGHSRSPMLHGYWLRTLGIDGAYEHADVPPEKFEDFFRRLKRNGFAGGNITIPHKEAAFRLVDRRERAADAIGAVNTVWYDGDTGRDPKERRTLTEASQAAFTKDGLARAMKIGQRHGRRAKTANSCRRSHGTK